MQKPVVQFKTEKEFKRFMKEHRSKKNEKGKEALQQRESISIESYNEKESVAMEENA